MIFPDLLHAEGFEVTLSNQSSGLALGIAHLGAGRQAGVHIGQLFARGPGGAPAAA